MTTADPKPAPVLGLYPEDLLQEQVRLEGEALLAGQALAKRERLARQGRAALVFAINDRPVVIAHDELPKPLADKLVAAPRWYAFDQPHGG